MSTSCTPHTARATADCEAWAEPPPWRLVGGTPLIPLDAGTRAPRLLLKAEWLNPGGSVKDRPALGILRAGVASGALPGRRLLDASSGNTAVAYAMLGSAAGIGVTVCVPTNVSAERRHLLRMYGAEVVDTDPLEGSDGAIRRARALATAQPDRFWYADQYSNPANTRAHYDTTGPEIWRATGGRITHLVAGVGTTGTVMGAGRFLKEQRSDIRIVAVQPDGPFHGLEGLKHLATAMVPGLYDGSLIDETRFMATEAAEARVRGLARDNGLFVGWSSGAAVQAAEELLGELAAEGNDGEVLVVAIAPDGGMRYLSEHERLLGQ